MIKNKLEIILIFTDGCMGCKVMNNLIREVLNDVVSKYDSVVTLRLVNFVKVNKSIFVDYSITDFPATIFKVNDDIKKVIIGTTTKRNIKDIIEKTISNI